MVLFSMHLFQKLTWQDIEAGKDLFQQIFLLHAYSVYDFVTSLQAGREVPLMPEFMMKLAVRILSLNQGPTILRTQAFRYVMPFLFHIVELVII